ncbi:CU044_5270 family protein [Nocardiopsis changdeensis]|uniref:CU044_5270 family protein n=1 Tax=Nocardiopsis changdeensis TaxID=2831969 RepID=A0ABX8BNJ2_9ACTN|nr:MULTISPECIES: CU044_5270 family protein [Nocardiopsis]QUX23810.1 CU044_5270 family protein [Nocardiopsis changdeensis]QYX39755.1 CU044_5270 family protein [Nocardiopsis sp. MT53]
MNELDHLRDLRSRVPERSPEELALLTGWRPGGRDFRPVRRPRLLPLALSGAAVVAAAALFLALVVFPGPLTVGVGPATEPSGEATEADAPAWDAMAPIIEAVRNQPVDGDVWYQRLTWGEARGLGPEGDRYGVHHIRSNEAWSWSGESSEVEYVPADAEASLSARRHGPAAWALVDERHRAAWERDGSPESWSHEETGDGPIPDASDIEGELLGPSGAGWYLAGEMREHRDLQELPSSPEALREMILAYDDPDAPSGEEDRLFSEIDHNLATPLPPETMAGMYTVLAGLSGLRPLGEVTDVAGRVTVGVAYTPADPGGFGTVEHRLHFDPVTGLLVSREQVVIEPSTSVTDWCEPGDLVDYITYETAWIAEPPL